MTNATELAAELIAGFRSPVDPQWTPRGHRRAAALGATTHCPPVSQPKADLLTTLRVRRSIRDFAPVAVPAGLLGQIVAAGITDDHETWPGEQVRGRLQVDVVALRVDGLEPGMFAFDAGARSYTPVAPLPAREVLYDMTIQREFCEAAAIVSIAADLEAAVAAHGAHGYRLLLGRASAAAYAMWLEAVAHGLVGSVFAGFIQASVRGPLVNDGASRHPIFALALGVPQAIAR